MCTYYNSPIGYIQLTWHHWSSDSLLEPVTAVQLLFDRFFPYTMSTPFHHRSCICSSGKSSDRLRWWKISTISECVITGDPFTVTPSTGPIRHRTCASAYSWSRRIQVAWGRRTCYTGGKTCTEFSRHVSPVQTHLLLTSMVQLIFIVDFTGNKERLIEIMSRYHKKPMGFSEPYNRPPHR